MSTTHLTRIIFGYKSDDLGEDNYEFEAKFKNQHIEFQCFGDFFGIELLSEEDYTELTLDLLESLKEKYTDTEFIKFIKTQYETDIEPTLFLLQAKY